MKKKLLIYLFLTGCILAQQSSLLSKYELARQYEAANDLQKAKEIYEELIEEDPNSPVYFNDLNDMYSRLGEYNNSIILIGKFLKKRPSDFDLYGKLGDAYFKMGKRDEAFSIWNNAVRIPTGNFMNYRVIANYLIQNRAYDEAIDMLSRGREIADNNDIFTLDIAHLYTVTMQFNKSAEEYCKYLLKQPQQLTSIQSRINAYLDRGDAANQFTKAIEEFHEDHQSTPVASLLSFLYKRQNDYSKAYEIDSELDKTTHADGQIIFNYANEAFSSKAYSEAAKGYKYIIDEIKNLTLLPNSYLGYVKSKEMELSKLSSENDTWEYSSVVDTSTNSEYRDLINEYKNIGKLFGRTDINSEIYYRIGYIYFYRLNNTSEAKKYFEQSLSEMKTAGFAFQAREELSKIYIFNNDPDKAHSLLTDLLKQQNIDPNEKTKYTLQLARIYFWQNNFSEALKLLNETNDNMGNDAANDALELALIINSANKDSVSLSKIARADLFNQQKKYSEAAEIYKGIYETPGLFYLSDLSGIKYVEMLLLANQVPLAVSVLENITSGEIPGIFTDKAVFLLGEIYQFAVMDSEKAKREYERILEDFPSSLYLDRAREKLLFLNSKERSDS